MKKFFVLFAVVMLFGAANAQDTLYFWHGGDFDGGTWNNIQSVGFGKVTEIPVYLMCTNDVMEVGGINDPFWVNKDYFPAIWEEGHLFDLGPHIVYDGRILGSMYGGTGPGWDEFNLIDIIDGDVNDSIPVNTWGISLFSAADVGGPANWYGTWPTVEMVYAFVNTTIADTTGLIGQTFCDAMGDGYYAAQNASIPQAFATDGETEYPTVWDGLYACLYFSPNVQPEPNFPDLGNVCTYEDYCFTFDIFDADGDELTVTVNGDVVTPISAVGGEDGVTYYYEVCYLQADLCGECFSEDIIINVEDGTSDPLPPANIGSITFIGEMAYGFAESEYYIWPGTTETLGLTLDACGPCVCVGALEFTVCYDDYLTLSNLGFTGAFAAGEYWHVSYGSDTDGPFFNVTWVADLPDSTDTDCVQAPWQGNFFEFDATLAIAEYWDGAKFEICFCGDDESLNSVTSGDGYQLWAPNCCTTPDSTDNMVLCLDLGCTDIKVGTEHNLLVGDINMNGFAFEVGDLVLLVNHIMDDATYPFTMRQMYASDVNGDGYQATVADVIFMINMVNGFDPGKVMPSDVIATVSMPENVTGNVDVMVSSEASVAGAVVTIEHSGVAVGTPVAEGWNLEYNDNGDVLTVIAYMDNQAFNAGSNVLFTVPVEGPVTFGNVEVSDARGALLDSRSELTTPLPKEFTVSQNFPNPFNAKTKINFTLPADGDVQINIYNVAGQLVESMDLGDVTAGYQSITWDASSVASGVYFYNVNYDGKQKTMKMTLLK
jgi:hypothetical protein